MNRYITSRLFSAFVLAAVVSCCSSDGTNSGSARSTRFEQEVERCALRSVCSGVVLDYCVKELHEGPGEYAIERGRLEREYGCAASGTCSDYLRCVANGDLGAACDESVEARCDGAALVLCSGGREIRSDCALTGQQCVTTETGPVCGWPAPCESYRCDGDGVLRCDMYDYQEVPVRYDCGDLGKGCVDGARFCVDESASTCSDDACRGSEMVYCYAGLSSSWDCRQIRSDYTCRMVNGNPECGAPESEVECDPRADASTCAGDIAHVCIAGRWEEIDCSHHHGATCLAEEDGLVRCTNSAGS
ncbi:MAG TPA: hypothetical protein VK524_31970 [Polyangiaceae bacterium]|nr:hypothetical protein [Polyangiaceae bacterium]